MSQPLVLVVERDDLLRDWIAACLSRSGCRVSAAPSAQAALESVQTCSPRPQLMLLDLFLPQINGLMLLAALRHITGMETVPAIMLSTLGFPEIVQQAIAAGAQDFLLKPFDPDVLLEKIRPLVHSA